MTQLQYTALQFGFHFIRNHFARQRKRTEEIAALRIA
jgi:hypothetical protein